MSGWVVLALLIVLDVAALLWVIIRVADGLEFLSVVGLDLARVGSSAPNLDFKWT